MSRLDLWSGEDDELLVITREQLRSLATRYALRGQRDFEAERYEDCVHSDDERCDTCAKEYQRLRRLHDVTAGHLMKARAELASLRLDKTYAFAELKLWRGSTHHNVGVPLHYLGDDYVTCSRAMEAVCEQDTVRGRTPQQTWWWLSAFKYVWRMWSKESPIGDAEKAIECLMHVLELLDGESDER